MERGVVVVAAAGRDVTNIAQAEQGALTVAGRCNIGKQYKNKRLAYIFRGSVRQS